MPATLKGVHVDFRFASCSEIEVTYALNRTSLHLVAKWFESFLSYAFNARIQSSDRGVSFTLVREKLIGNCRSRVEPLGNLTSRLCFASKGRLVRVSAEVQLRRKCNEQI